MQIIPLQAKHYDEVKSIHNEGIASGVATFETNASEWPDWNQSHLPNCRIVSVENEVVLGWAALSPISSRSVYRGVAEVSVYVKSDSHGKGIGKKLLESLIAESENNQIWTLQASVIRENIASIKLHHAAGFRTVGFREKLGHYNDTWHDVVLLEKRSKKLFYNVQA